MSWSPACWANADDADPFLLGHLSPEERESVQVHLNHCYKCRSLVDEAAKFIDLMRTGFLAYGSSQTEVSSPRPFIERRCHPRKGAGQERVTVIDAGGEIISALLLDVGENGALIETTGQIAVGDRILLKTPSINATAQVRHAEALDGTTICGLAFADTNG